MPKISVVIPSYNHEKYIAEAIQSVLDQSYQDFEIVIVDDGSTDGTVAEIKKFDDGRIKLICFDENRGASVAARRCIEESKGEYISALSSDDLYIPDKFERQLSILDDRPDMGAVFSYAQIIDEEGNDFSSHRFYNRFRVPNRTRYEWLNCFFNKGNFICHTSALIRRQCYHTIGYYDERYAQLPDFDFWIRLCMKYEIHIIPEDLVKFRIRRGEANVSGKRADTVTRAEWEYVHILKNYLGIKSYDEFITIFPNALEDCPECEVEAIPFLIAQLALKIDSPAHRFFGIETLFNLLGDEDKAKRLEKNFGFSYADFVELTGKYGTLLPKWLSDALQIAPPE